jgi:hypothetical protein
VEWVLGRVPRTLVGLGYERRCGTGIAEVVGVRFRVAAVDTGLSVGTCLVRVWKRVYEVSVGMRVGVGMGTGKCVGMSVRGVSADRRVGISGCACEGF